MIELPTQLMEGNPMSELGVRRLIAELIENEDFKKKFFLDPESTMKSSGFELSDLEIGSLKNLQPQDVELIVSSEGQLGVKLKTIEVW